MSVIAELTVDAEAFELGRILELESGEYLELETMVPLGQRAVPFFRVHDQVRETFEEAVKNHPSVDWVQELDKHGDERLFSLDWDTSTDHFFNAMSATGAQLLTANGSISEWRIELRFPSYDALSRFHDLCENARIHFELQRVYNPTKPTLGPWYGLSEPQREALMRAVEGGYYSIPRQLSTKGLADEFEISDQAVTERLRRAIVMLTQNTLLVVPDTTDENDS